MTHCPEARERAAMTDDEFWQHVLGKTPEEEEAWAEYHWSMNSPDIWVIDCIRCGCSVEIPEGVRHTRERDAFCDECSEEHYPYEEEEGIHDLYQRHPHRY